MICHFSVVQVHFVFCQLNFIVLFPFLLKYYHILYIIIVFRLGSDLWGRWMICLLFEYLSSFCFLLIEFHSTFSISYKILLYFVYYYCSLAEDSALLWQKIRLSKNVIKLTCLLRSLGFDFVSVGECYLN